MANSTITFRTDSELKKEATELFDSLGMNLSVALNMFMRQAVIKKQFPCSIDSSIAENDAKSSYPAGFFNLFGSGANLGLDEEPEEVQFTADSERVEL